MSDTTKINNLIQQITTNIANNNISGAISDSEILKTNLRAFRKSGINIKIETILQKIKETNLIAVEHIECMVDDPTCYVFTNTLTRTDGEKYLLKFYNHIENDQNFQRAIELFQSNLIQNKCLEFTACTNDSIHLMRKVMQMPNGNLFDTFVNRLCAFDYPIIPINNLMGIFLIEPHQPEFVASELIREAFVASMETKLQREASNDLDSFCQYLFDETVSTELLKKCCDNFLGFYDLIQTAITKQSKSIEHLETDDGDFLWYFKYETLGGNRKFNDFAKFICKLASPPALDFTHKFLVFLKNIFPPKLLNHIFARIQ
ncbi:uncharacterized protein LOC119067112 [Bradysia coprophila]|uniref:uncharacterized protein LOC119067112 n=1 Tax=Bradysia coprophila TaxID=38358 RepID=UPI00187D8B56|nr:uncharacterized protein LOC119067112 [Bradysia coprophila]